MKCKLVFAILDGFGIEKSSVSTIKKANPKFYNFLASNYPFLEIDASGECVGLSKDQSGNSEVGHVTIGSGRTIEMGKKLIDKNLSNIKNSITPFLKKSHNKNNVHLLGMTSSGNIHSNYEHLFFLIDICNKYKIKPILHLVSDGRDCDSKQEFLEILEKIDEIYIKKNKAFIGTISGRFFAMDRNEKWDRTLNVFQKMCEISNDNISPIEYCKKCYQNKIFDEFIEPKSFNNPQTIIHDNDIFITYNYRSDRIRQICHLLKPSKVFGYKNNELFDIKLITFTDYKLDNQDNVCVPFPKINDYLGEIISINNLSQLRIAETEKYAHMTYYFDCMNSIKPKNCDAILIPSPNVKTYDLKPKMNARFITKEVLNSIDKYDVIFLNFANTDMVGHTGNLKASIKAIKCIDKQLKIIYNHVFKKWEIPIIISSDHGNVEKIIDENDIIYTNHTSNKVPFIFISNKVKLNGMGGNLTNIAPTILDYLGLDIPKSMSASLIKKE